MTFQNPILSPAADPWITKKDGWYYLTRASDNNAEVQEGENAMIFIRKSRSLIQIGEAEAVCVYKSPRWDSKEGIWAPELHFLNEKWYIYFADVNNGTHMRSMFALESVTDDPQGEYNGKGDIQLPHWAIDGTILLAPNNKLYFVWSGIKDGELRADNMIYGEQGLYIAEMSNPWTITGEPICISLPTYEWEKNGPTGVNEGPTFLKRHDRIFAIYSASHSFTDHYCLGMLELIGEDPLDQSAWKKSENPAFSAANGVYGPGHASFTLSPDDTEDWILYHAAVQSGAAWNRDVRAQKFGWNNDGTPFFGYPVAPGNKIPVPSGEK